MTMASDELASTARKFTITHLSKSNNNLAILFTVYISSLAPGVPYQVQVVAYTTVGRGALNDYVTFFSKQLDPMKPPDNVTVVRISRTSINVSWTPLNLVEARGFPKYNVVLFIRGNLITMVNTAESFALFNNLQGGTEYSVVVGVTTNGSTSPLQSSPIIG